MFVMQSLQSDFVYSRTWYNPRNHSNNQTFKIKMSSINDVSLYFDEIFRKIIGTSSIHAVHIMHDLRTFEFNAYISLSFSSISWYSFVVIISYLVWIYTFFRCIPLYFHANIYWFFCLYFTVSYTLKVIE